MHDIGANLQAALATANARINELAAQETAAILADPNLMAAIESSEADIAAGRGIPWEDVKKELGLDAEPQKETTMDEQTPRKRPSPDDVPDEVMKRIMALYDRELSDEERAEIEDFGQRLASRLHALKLSVPTAAEFNAAIDITAGEPHTVSGPYRVIPNTDGVYDFIYGPDDEPYGGRMAMAFGKVRAERIADALNMQAFMATKIETLSGLLGEVLAGRGIHTAARTAFVVELSDGLVGRIRAALKEAVCV